MNLALFFTSGVSLGDWAGIGLIEREVAIYRRLMADHGAGVSFITYGGRGECAHAGRLSGIGVHGNSWGLPKSLYRRLISRLHEKVLRQATVIKSNQVLGSDVALAAARRYGKPFVARCGYLYSDFMEKAHGGKSPQIRAARDLEERVYTGADRVVVTTQAMRTDILDRYGLDAEKVQVIPNYVDTELFKQKLELVSEPSAKARRICFVGRLAEQKNLFTLFDAIKGLDVELLLVGDGHLRTMLEAKAKDEGLDVHFLGNVPHGDLPDIFAKSSLFVLPSRYEGHPKALIEAMASGLAVIGTDVPGIGDLIEHSRTGVLCPPTKESLREAIQTVLDDAPLREGLGWAAREYVLEHFTLGKIARAEYSLLAAL